MNPESDGLRWENERAGVYALIDRERLLGRVLLDLQREGEGAGPLGLGVSEEMG